MIQLNIEEVLTTLVFTGAAVALVFLFLLALGAKEAFKAMTGGDDAER